MNAPTGTPRSLESAPILGPAPYAEHDDADRPTGPVPAPGPVRATTPAPRTVRLRVAGLIATAAFLLGLGVSMLLGPIMGGPPEGGAGGPGGAPGTSQTTQQGAAT